MAVYLGKHKVGMVKKFKGVDRLQWKCDNLKSLAYEFRDAQVEDLSPMLNGLDTSAVTTMRYSFYCTNTTTSKLTRLDLSHFNTSNVTSMEYMFYNCRKLVELDVSNFDVSKVTTFGYMFYGCAALPRLDLSHFRTPTLKTMDNVFAYCAALEELDLTGWDTSKATTMSQAFRDLPRLKRIIGVIDMYSVTGTTQTFYGDKELEEVTLKNIRKSIQLGATTSYGTKITEATLINTIKELWDFTGSTTTYTLSLSTASKKLLSNIYVKLVDVTDDMIAVDQYAANKLPCVVCDSTDEGAMLITDYATAKGWTIA